MEKNREHFLPIKKIIFAGSLCLLIIATLLVLAGCSNMGGVYGRTSYSIDDLKIDSYYSKMEILQGYKGYSGRVAKITPANSTNWSDYSRAVFKDWDILDTGQYHITVSMSVMVEKPVSETPTISAYRLPERSSSTPSNIRWNGPASLGWTVQNGEDFYAQFGGNATVLPAGKWVDINLSEAFEFKNLGTA